MAAYQLWESFAHLATLCLVIKYIKTCLAVMLGFITKYFDAKTSLKGKNYEIKRFYIPIFFLHQNLAQILNYELRLVL